MKTNDRVKSQYNTGTVLSVSDPVNTVTIQWDGFSWPTEVPASIAREFQVIGSVEPGEPAHSGPGGL